MMTSKEKLVYLTQKFEMQGGLSPEDLKELNDLISESLATGSVTAEEVKGSNGVVDEEKAGKLAAAWSCTVGMAKKVWNAIWSFLCSIGRCMKDGFSKIGSGLKGLFSRKPKAEGKVSDQVIDITAQKVA